LIIIILISALSACTGKGGNDIKRDEEIQCGGTVERSFDAPKVINSKDLTSMEAEFFYITDDENYDYDCLRIKLERNEKNELILSEEYSYGTSIKVGEEVLGGAQEIIEKFNLSALNGTDKHTSALPPPYSPMFFKAEYSSGERIYFYVDGNPEELWCNGFAEYFLNVFEEYGETLTE
jgi:hypothetical protein